MCGFVLPEWDPGNAFLSLRETLDVIFGIAKVEGRHQYEKLGYTLK